jgi:hypothetical protein
LRAYRHAPSRGGASGEPWWTIGFGISICLLFTCLSIVGLAPGYLYFAAAVLNYATTRFYFWLDRESPWRITVDFGASGFFAVNAIALSLPAIAWLMMEIKFFRQGPSSRPTPFHKVAASISLALLSLILLFQWAVYAEGNRLSSASALLNRMALGSVIALFVACLWDEDSEYAKRGLYGMGLIAIGMILASFNPSHDALLVSVVVTLSLYALLVGVLWRGQDHLRDFANLLRVPLNDKRPERFFPWLITANGALAVITFTATFLAVFNIESFSQRLIATTATIAIPVAFALLVGFEKGKRLITKAGTDGQGNGAKGDERSGLQPGNSLAQVNKGLIAATVWGSFLTAISWGWAWVSPIDGIQVVNRAVIVMVIVETILLGHRFIVKRILPSDNWWRCGVRGQLLNLTIIGLGAFFTAISIEAANVISFGGAGVAWPVIIAIFSALILLFWACIAFALSQKPDPFTLSERGRMAYVYGAEGVTVITLLHARLTLPWLFGGFFLTWWPLVVMALAFTGVGLSEIFQRRGKLVLAEPLERTGIMLPLLPVIGFWVIHSNVTYSGLLFLVGLFYGALSVMRRSISFGVLAILAGNGGLWKLLDGIDGYGFYQHPQLWLIPVALSVLAAARVNRDRLTQEQMTIVRYAALIAIYVSSTSDIFVNGVSESPWLTIVLAALSVLGVIAGLMLRVRAFLFLGTAFLLLSMLTLIWTASVHLNWGWLWYVAGIGMGVLILFTAILFDRKRLEMLRLVERLKQWQA